MSHDLGMPVGIYSAYKCHLYITREKGESFSVNWQCNFESLGLQNAILSQTCVTHTQLSVGHVEHEKSIVLSYSLYDTL